MGRNEKNISQGNKPWKYLLSEELMIFVTVGTHEQQFNRLVEYMDKWAENHDEEVIIQTGFSTYEPKKAKWQKLFLFKEMDANIKASRIVITHGGPSSFIAPLQIRKIPIVVPRMKKFGEHVNDHQVNFCREVVKRQRNIIEIENIEKLGEAIGNYNTTVAGMTNGLQSNNEIFCKRLEMMVNGLLSQK